MPRKPKTKTELEEALKEATAAKTKLEDRVGKLEQDAALAKLKVDERVVKLEAQLADAKQRNPPAAPPPKTLAELGPPPTDALEANKWAHNAMLFALHDVATDKDISPRERRKEMRTIAASIAKLTPTAEIQAGVEIVRGAREEVERKKPRGATLEKRPKRGGDG